MSAPADTSAAGASSIVTSSAADALRPLLGGNARHAPTLVEAYKSQERVDEPDSCVRSLSLVALPTGARWKTIIEVPSDILQRLEPHVTAAWPALAAIKPVLEGFGDQDEKKYGAAVYARAAEAYLEFLFEKSEEWQKQDEVLGIQRTREFASGAGKQRFVLAGMPVAARCAEQRERLRRCLCAEGPDGSSEDGIFRVPELHAYYSVLHQFGLPAVSADTCAKELVAIAKLIQQDADDRLNAKPAPEGELARLLALRQRVATKVASDPPLFVPVPRPATG